MNNGKRKVSQTGVCGSIGNAEFHSILTPRGSSILTLYLNNNILVMLIVIK